MDALIERALNEPSFGAAHGVLSPDQPSEAHQPLGDQQYSTTLAAWLMNSEFSTASAGSLAVSHTCHMCSCHDGVDASRKKGIEVDVVKVLGHRALESGAFLDLGDGRLGRVDQPLGADPVQGRLTFNHRRRIVEREDT